MNIVKIIAENMEDTVLSEQDKVSANWKYESLGKTSSTREARRNGLRSGVEARRGNSQRNSCWGEGEDGGGWRRPRVSSPWLKKWLEVSETATMTFR